MTETPANSAATLSLIIFDCDGVLVDSEPISNRVLAEAIAQAGCPMSYAQSCAAYTGRTMEYVVNDVERRLGRPLPQDWLADFEQREREAFKRELQAVQNVAAAIEAVRDDGRAVCVASSGSLEKMALTLGLTGLGKYFVSQVYSVSMVARPKPEPDIFLHAARTLGYPAQSCAVIEDSGPGVAAGLAAGMTVFAYCPAGNGEAFHAAGARSFSSMAELPALLGVLKV